MATLILDNEIENKFNSINFTNSLWESSSINSKQELIENIILGINILNPKLNVSSVEFRANGIRSKNFGYIIENGIVLTYLFVIAPGNTGRNVVAQNIMSGIYHIIEKTIPSNIFKISDKPCILLNLNEDTITALKAQEIIGAKILGFKYFDIFGRDCLSALNDKFQSNNYSCQLYDGLIKDIGSNRENKYFLIDENQKKIVLKTETLGNVETNERYFYSMKIFPLIYLAIKEKYKIDIENLLLLSTKPEPIKSLISFIDKHNIS